jgi:DNA adenine methylase
VEQVIEYLNYLDGMHEKAADPKQFYYDVRAVFNKVHMKSPEQAARFIYLNKHCFNGLYRVNSKGEFNVPFNGKLTGGSFDAEHLREVSKQIHDVMFMLGDFEDCVHTAEAGDFCFIDSPYAPLTATSFTDYTKEGFEYQDHVRLAQVFKELSDKGVYCMLTNHDTPLIRELYKDYNIKVVDVRRSINRNGDNRKGKEVIITNY